MNILDLRNPVLAELPQSKDLFVEKLLLEGIRDLCKKSYCWKTSITRTSVKDQAVYPMTISVTKADIIGFWEGSYDNVKLDNMAEREMDVQDKSWESRKGTPTGIMYDGDTSIRFNITPNTSGKSIKLEPVIAPNDIEGVVPPKIEKRHTETVKDYVKWKVYMTPGPLFNPQLATIHRKDYERGRNSLKLEVAKDYSENTEVRPRSFVTGNIIAPIGFPLNL